MKQLEITEIEWYRMYGKYPDRISKDSTGNLYMIGDWSWNRNNPDKQEVVEHRIPYQKDE